MEYDRGLTYARLLAVRKQYRIFKERHWNAARNHLSTDSLDEFYAIYREGIKAKADYTKSCG